MLKMTIDGEEVVSKNNFTIKEEMLSPSSTILNNTYPKTWEDDKDYTSRFYYPKDYAKLNIQNFSITPEEAGTTIQVNGSATLTDVDTTKESRVLRLLGQTSQTGTPTPSSPIPVNVVSGDNEINICGKNLFDNILLDGIRKYNCSVSYEDGEIVLTATGSDAYIGDIANAGTSWTETKGRLIKVQPNTTYTFSTTNNNITKNYVTQYNSDKISLSVTRYNSNEYTFTTSSSTEYISLRIGKQDTTSGMILKFNVQLEKGSTATTYEPYIGNTYTISLGDIELCKIGTYQDYIYKDNGSWYLHKEIGKVVLDGSETWSKNTGQGFVIPANSTPFSDRNTSVYDGYSDRFIFNKTSTTWSNDTTLGFSATNVLWLRYDDMLNLTINEWKTWLSNNNTIVYYVLATPTNTLIEDTTLISQLDALESQ